MNPGAIGTIIGKDFREFTRNRFFVFITILVLVAYVVIFWFLPDSVDETVHIGVTGFEQISGLGGDDGLEFTIFATEEDLRSAVEEGEDGIVAGVAFPDSFTDDIAAGNDPTVILLVPAGLPSEQQAMMEGLVSEAAYTISGSPPLVNPITEALVLGTDRVGAQISLQEQMRPLILILVLMVETFALSSLVAIEVQQRTVTAILVTPTRIRDFIAAKGIFGTGLAFSEVVLLAALIGALGTGAPIILVSLLLGAILVTGFGMIAGSFGRDFLETMFVSMAFMIPLMVPAFGALFPGSAALWVQALPTYGLVEAVIDVSVDGAGWDDVGASLAILAIWGIAAFVAGAAILRRRVATI